MPVGWTVEEPPIVLEPDLKRLAGLVEVFKQMNPAERRRALNYLSDRFAPNPPAQCPPTETEPSR